MKTTLPVDYLLYSSCFKFFPSIFLLTASSFPVFIFFPYFLNIAGEAENSKGFLTCDPSVPCKLRVLSYKREFYPLENDDLDFQILDVFPAWCLR